MIRFLKITCLVILNFLTAINLIAQCPHHTLSASGCGIIGSTALSVWSPNATKIDWYENGSYLSTTNSTPATAGTTVVGNPPLQYPQGVFVDGGGNVYVADNHLNQVLKFAPCSTTGTVVAGALNGVAGAGTDSLSGPIGVFVVSDTVYVADEFNSRVMKWAPPYAHGITVAGGNGYGSNANQLSYPTGIFVDGSGNIFIADISNQRVQKWVSGAINGITVAGGNGGGCDSDQLTEPTGVYVINDTVYVTNHSGGNITKWAPGATFGSTVLGYCGVLGSDSTHFYAPFSTFFDCNRNIYVADEGNHRIQKFAPGSTSGVTVAGGNGAGNLPNQLSYPDGIFVDGNGSIFVADTRNGRIQKWAQNFINAKDSPTTAGTYTAVVTYNCCVDTTNAVSIIACPTPTLTHTGEGCKDSVLIVTNATCASKIIWQKNGTTIDSALSVPSSTIIAGVSGSSGTADNKMNQPYGLFRTVSGDIYVADRGNHRILKFPAGSTAGSNGTVVAGGNGMGSAANKLNFPTSVALDTCGNLYVCDQSNHRIQKFPAGSDSTTNGTTIAGITGVSGSTASKLNTPFGICLDASGNLYVSDSYNNRVQYFPANSTSGTNGVTVAGYFGAGSDTFHLNRPTGIFVDGNVNLYVAEDSNNRVMKWIIGNYSGSIVAGGNGTGTGATNLNSPANIFVDSSGNLYVADLNRHRIQMFPSGSNSSTAGITVAGMANGNGGAGNGQLYYPQGVTVDSIGNVYVSERGLHRVTKWSPSQINNTKQPRVTGGYRAIVTYNGGCGIDTTNVDSLLPYVTPAVTIHATATTITCHTSVTFSVTTANAGTNPQYQWFKNSIAVTSLTYATTYTDTLLLNHDTITCKLTSSTPCSKPKPVKSGNKIIMTVIGSCPSRVIGGSYKLEAGTNELFNLYPNPTNSILNCQIASEGDLRIVDGLGQVVIEKHLTEQETPINIRNLAAGVYFYTFQSGDQVNRGKVVKE